MDNTAFIFPFLSNDKRLDDPDRLYCRLSSLTAMINLRLKKIALLADIDKKLSSHIARHSFADIARKKGMKIYDISKALGHTSLAITEKRLSGFDDDALEGAMERIFE